MGLSAIISIPGRILLFSALSGLLPKGQSERWVEGIVLAANRFFLPRFELVPFHRRLLLLPYCLRARDCPGRIDPNFGLCCVPGCLKCQVGEMKRDAEDLGYIGVYVVVSGRLHRETGILPSRQFIERLIRTHRPGAVIGAICARDLARKYLRLRYLSPWGAGARKGTRVQFIPQVMLLDSANCRHSGVDWSGLSALIRARKGSVKV